MKMKKMKLLKICGLLTGALMIGTIPIITTSCGEKTQTGDNNQTPSKPGGDSGTGGGTGGDQSGGTGGQTQQKKVPKFNESLTTNIKYSDVYNEGKVQIDETLVKFFSDKNNIKKALSNGETFTSDELSKTTLTVLTKYDQDMTTKNTWGSTNYETWVGKSKATFSYQPTTSLQVDVSKSLKDVLKNAETLKNIASASGIDLSENKTISLNETNKPKLSSNTFNVCVDITTPQKGKSGPTIESDLLEIPLSSLVLNLKSANVDLKSTSATVQEDTKSNINLNLDVLANSSPISDEDAFKKGFILADNTSKVTEDSFIKDLNLSQAAPANLLEKQNLTKEEPAQKLNSRKLSDMFKIYNADFSNLKIVSKSGDKNPGDDGYTGLFKITIDATLHNNFYWDDGSTGKKVLTEDNVSIKLKLSDWKDGASGGITSPSATTYSDLITIGKAVNQTSVDEYFKNEAHYSEFIKKYIAKNTQAFTKCNLIFKSVTVKENNQKADLVVTIKPKEGLAFKGDKKEKDITITLTNIKQ